MSFSSRVICDPPPPATRMIRVISAAVWALPVALSIAALVATPSKTGTALAELFKSKDFVQDIRISVASLLDTEATLQDPESFRKTASTKRYRTIFDMRLRNEKTFPMKLAYLPQPTVRAARPHIQTAEKSTLKAAPVMTLAAKPGISRETVATIAPQSQTFASAPLVQTRTFQNARVASANALSVGGMTIVLTGINPPRTGSKCRRLDGALLDCIDRAEARMAILLIGRTVTCRISQPVREGYVAGQCKAGKIDIAHDLLRHGLANRTTAANSNTLL